jgi:putative ABC transport system permease protein
MTWWQRLWRRRQMEEELDKELRFHLDQHATDLIARGHEPEEARRQARLALGGPERVKENCREVRGTRWLEDLWQDFRYALRTLRQRPGFAAVALCTLALGSGATTVMFTVVNGVLLKPLSYPEPERLVTLHEQTEKYGGEWSFAYFNFVDCKRESRSLAPMAAWRYAGGTVSEPGEAQYVSGRQVSAGLFSVLGIDLLRGRAFLPEEDRPGAAPVVNISYRLWQRVYGGNPEAIGRQLVFNGKAYTVVGIVPAGLRLSGDVDVFTPLGQNTEPIMQNREMHPGIRVVARLRPGVALAQAQAELALIGRHLAERYPKSNEGHGIVAQPLQQELVRGVRSTLWLLLGAVSIVLLIACVNVASLLLARAVSRERELAMRVALGAGRGRLVRQCLTESAVLALSGGLLGVLLAAVGTRPFLMFWPGSLPRTEEVQFDWRVLLFAVAASLLSGILFGLAPALRAPARDLEQALRAGARTVAGSSRRLHGGFVISEIALAAVLLVSAGMLGRTLLRLSSVDPGVDVRNVLVTRVALSPSALVSPAITRAAWRDLLDRVRRVPGVRSVAMTDLVPLGGDDEQIGYWTTAAAPPANQIPLSLMFLVTPDYLQSMGIPLLRGRFFDEQDRIGNELVVVIDDVLAQRAFHGRDPVGNRLWLQFLGPAKVVGVVGHVRHWGLDVDDRAKVREEIYLPFAQLPDEFLRLTSTGMSLVMRTTVAPLNTVEAVRRQVRGATRDQALYEVRTMEQIVSATLARQRFLLLLFGVFGGLALLLACIGIYGVLAYLTTQRVPEIGVRMALGASALDVMRLVFRQSLGMILAGIGVGIAAALAAGRLLERLVAGVRPMEPLTFTIMISVLVVAALFASFVPARRASRVDPMSALRQE